MSVRLCVIGSGAVGSLFTAKALEAGFDVTRAVRQPRSGAQQTTVKTVTLQNDSTVSLPDAIITPDSQVDILFDLNVIPVKVYQLKEALTQWSHLFTNNTPALLLQNGMGGDEIFRSVLPSVRLYQATTSHGALRQQNAVRHTGFGETLAGPATGLNRNDSTDEKVFRILEQAFPPVTRCDNIALALWQKLSVNLVINPLTALHNIRNGQLLEPAYDAVISSLCRETSLVMQACGYKESADVLKNRVVRVAGATAVNYSSMHQDAAHGRPLETGAITGYLLEKAAAHHIPVPAHQSLFDALTDRFPA